MSTALPSTAAKHPTPEEERQIPREVLRVVIELRLLQVRDGRLVVPEDVSSKLAPKSVYTRIPPLCGRVRGARRRHRHARAGYFL